MSAMTESVVENAALAWLQSIGWRIAHGPGIAPDMPAAGHRDPQRGVLARRNPWLPAHALEDAFRTRPEGAELIPRNRALCTACW